MIGKVKYLYIAASPGSVSATARTCARELLGG
jgi:hypothetical protein